MTRPFDQRHVVITGGTGALGTAVVAVLLDAGASCHVTYLEPRELEKFPFDDRVSLHRVNVESEDEVARLYSTVPKLWASLHIVGGFAMNPIEKCTADDFLRMFRLNALTCFLCCREAIRVMRRNGAGGRIVNVAARVAVVPTPGMIAYATAKSAVAAITTALAEEVRDENILVNAILPSIMDTPANRRSMPDADFERWPTVEQVAQAMLFLASPDNTLATGALVPLYGRGV